MRTYFGPKCSKSGENVLTHSKRLNRSLKNGQPHSAISILLELISICVSMQSLGG